MELKTIDIEIPEDCNIILGQTHFIKSIEDLYEVIKNCTPNAMFGIAFDESSGDCLVRWEGNDSELVDKACSIAYTIGAGHVFVILLRNAYPINVLNSIKEVPEVCSVYCATANPVQVIVAESSMGRGIMGVIDGFKPKGIENEKKKNERKKLLRTFGYKL
jgi:hypothetical protein